MFNQGYLRQISVSSRAVGSSFGNGADWAYLCFCFIQRRENIEYKIPDPSELLSIQTCFLVGCIGFIFRLGQAGIWSTVCAVLLF